MVTTADGKQRFGNRMKANRYNKSHPAEEGKDKGPRAQAHAIEGTAHEPGMAHEVPEHEPEGDMHAEVKQVHAEHGPAHEIHIAHDHESGQSRVHSVHPDGHQHMGQHAGPDHVMHAHHHAMHAAGHDPEANREEEERESPEEQAEEESEGGEEY